jgi:CHAD domain-containing protein
VRDIDVLLPKLDGEDRERLARARAVAMGEARIALDSFRARDLMIGLVEWLTVGGWRTRPAEPLLAGDSIIDFAAHLLERHHRRLKKRGDHLAKLGDDARHRARIEAKKLRYATEFFACLWPGKRAQERHKRYREALEELQDHLGGLNDIAVAAALLERHDIGAPGPDEDRRKLLRRAEKAFDALMDAEPFWC